ncbi:MAG: hypothetical protein HN416_11855, partial [Nitrospina sp.]|nr:hypothetical protein [Nitrospina sp.]
MKLYRARTIVTSHEWESMFTMELPKEAYIEWEISAFTHQFSVNPERDIAGWAEMSTFG